MNLGSNFNNQKLFTGEAKSTTRSIDMNRYGTRNGAVTTDQIMMRRLKMKDQLNPNIYGPEQMRKLNNKTNNQPSNPANQSSQSLNDRKFNHIEAMRNIKRGI